MDFYSVQDEIRALCKTSKWKQLVDLIDDGSKGMFLILRILADSDGDVVAGDLAKIMCVSTARIASALNTLEKKGYVRRESEKTDARKVVIRLTDVGKSALDERMAGINQIVAPMFANLTDEEIKTLFYLVNKFLA